MSSSEADVTPSDPTVRSAAFRSAHRRPDPIDRPRPLGAKRSALQAQRHRQSVVEWHVGLIRTARNAAPSSVLISADGTTAFAISRTMSGLVVEKRHCPPVGPRTSHAMLFESEATFDNWCDAEPIRFHEPLLCDQLRRRGHAILALHG